MMLEFFLAHLHYTADDHKKMAWLFMVLRDGAKANSDWVQESYYWNEAMMHHNMALLLAPKSGIMIDEEF